MKFYDFLTESINDKGILKAIFMSGISGAGKSYTLSKITSGSIEPRIVNTDKFTEFFKAFHPTEWRKYQSKIKILTKTQLSNYLNGILPLYIDSTSSNSSAMFRRNGILKSIGYDTGMIWIDVDLDTALKRAEKRERKVDPKFIKEIHSRLYKIKDYYKDNFKFFIEINNNDAELTNEVILSTFKKIQNFYLEPVINPIGIELIEKMKENKYKYLTEYKYSTEYLKKLVDSWYRK